MIVKRKDGSLGFRLEPKRPCQHRGPRRWLPLDARVNFTCTCHDCRCYPGACLEDWRTKKVICDHYTPKP